LQQNLKFKRFELYILKDGKLFEEFDWKEEGLEKTYEKYF